MEIITEFTSNPLFIYIPVALALVGVVLVFTFGIKAPEQPPFDKLTAIDDRKPAGKKRKIKEKKTTANGHVASGDSKQDKSPTKRSPIKETESKQKLIEKQTEKIKKNDVIKNNNNNNNNKHSLEEVKNKKNLKKITEKPVDYDEGDWETVPSKADKKKKPEQTQSPAKKDKKSNKKVEKADKVEIEKLVKEVSNKELQELEKESKMEIIQNNVVDEPVIVIEEKKEKKKEKKVKNEAVEKAVEIKEVAHPKEVPKSKPEKAVPVPVEPKGGDTKDSGAVAFDELGDVWTEAKVPKKSKKKSRRDN